MRIFVRVAAVLAAVLGVGGYSSSAPVTQDRILSPVESTQVARVRGTAHPRARAQYDQGRTDPSRTISGAITFRLSAAQQTELDQLLREQQDPKSPNYHRWITPDQYAARFGMTPNDLAKVSSWLQSQGLNVNSISRNHNEISFSGSVGQVEYAFKTEIHNYTIRGEQHFANAMDVSLPAAFSQLVLGVRGLDTFAPKPHIHPAPRLTSNLTGNHFLTPCDFWTIYNVPATNCAETTYTGAGQTIAIIGQTTISTTDLDTFRTNSGLPLTSASNFQQVLVGGTATNCTGDEGEADLDLEWSEGVASQAKIIYVFAGVETGGTCNNRSNNVFNALQDAITNNRAPIISISYGNCEANLGSFVMTLQQWAQEANAQGQTISGPAGDQGAADCESATATTATHGLAVDVPASIPEVTGVGGSEFNGDATQCPVNQQTGIPSCPGNVSPADSPYWNGSSSLTSGPSALAYIPETTWNDTTTGSPLSATGGGASLVFGKPSWQTGTGVPSDGKRDVPDIALNASPAHDPYLICGPGDCTTGFRSNCPPPNPCTFSAVGGTSAGAPTFAGILALISQAISSNGLGNVNPMLYSLAANNSANNAFHSITSGDNKVPCTSGTTNCASGTTSIGFSAGAGYDQTTGLGSMHVANLITAWKAVTPSADFTVESLTSSTAAGGTGTSMITVTALNGFTGAVNLTCSPSSSAAQITCSLNPTSLDMSTGTTNGTKTATLSMVTVADLQIPNRWQRRGTWFAATGGLFAAVLLGGASSRRRRLGIVGLFVVVAVLTGVACGGGGGSSTQQKSQGTPAGSYTVTVTATSGSTTHTTTVNLTVQ